MSDFSIETRAKNLTEVEDIEFDLAVIGGGITGAGVARDASSRGMKVAVFDMQDFAAGTSSRSSKLIHGGIRYLENLEFGLVFEALRERARLFEMAPHLVHPLRFLLPLYHGDRVGPFKMGLGMWLYDILSLFDAPEMHESLGVSETLARVSSLKQEGLRGSFVYSDAYMDDDRLVLETLRSASRWGAKIFNYMKVEDAILHENKMGAILCKDQLTGKTYRVCAKHFVSTVGPWTDEVGERLLGDWTKMMRPSKGVHLTVSRARFPIENAIVMAAGKENRIIFAIPRHEMVIFGTTDTDFKQNPLEVRTDIEDVTYLLRIINDYFPQTQLQESDIIASYSGVRPLVHDGSGSESKTSREHTIFSDERNITFVSGGKYTTYREMAEETVDRALGAFTVEEQSKFLNSNTICPLNEKVTQEKLDSIGFHQEEWSQSLAVPSEDVQFLLQRHGQEAWDFFSKYQNTKRDEFWKWRVEAQYAVDSTMCIHLDDFYLRRVPLFLAERDHGLSMIEVLSTEFASRLGWSDSVRQEEIGRVHAHLQKEMAWRRPL